MNILILYATYSGGTQTASQIIFDQLKSKHTVTYKTPLEIDPKNINKYDLVIFCSPTWDYNGKEGQPHEDFINFFEKAKHETYSNINFAVMGLGDSSYTKFCGCVEVIEIFIKNHGGLLKIPSLKIDGFFFNQNENLKVIQNWTNKLI
jgi:flavodoxin I